jgi:hypothetical protein
VHDKPKVKEKNNVPKEKAKERETNCIGCASSFSGIRGNVCIGDNGWHNIRMSRYENQELFSRNVP